MKITGRKNLLAVLIGLFAKSNIGQQKSNYYQQKCYKRCNIDIPEINVHKKSLLNLYARNRVSIPTSTSTVNTTNLSVTLIPGNAGPASAKPNQKTEKLIRKSAITEIKTESLFNINADFITIKKYFQFLSP